VPDSAGVLVGRRTELETLNTVLEDPGPGAVYVVQIVGEQGIGKTRLVSEACREAERRRYLVFDGRSAELEGGEPFGVLVDALDDFLATLERRDLTGIESELDLLAWVFPAIARLVGRPQELLAAERYRAHRAVRGLLEVLGTRQPVVLALDDVHWADEASTEFLSYLVRRPPRGRVVTLLCFRPAQLEGPFAATLDASAMSGGSLRLDLAPLTSDEADELMGSRVPAAARAEVYRLSGGNPLYIDQLARAGDVARAEVPRAGPDSLGAPVPAVVRRGLAAEIAALSPGARSLVQGAAVIGDPFEVGLAATAAATPAGQDLATIDELVDADLVRPGSMPRRFAFRHPLVRHAIYDSAPAGWRIGAHGRAARALDAQGAGPVARAHHVERSAQPGDVAAAGVLIEAADASAGRAPATAAHWYEAALRILPDAPAAGSGRLAVLEALAPMLQAIGRLEDSRAVLLEALELAPPTDAAQRVRISASCSAVERLLGLYAIADDRLHRALAELPDPQSREAAVLDVGMSISARAAGDPIAAERRAHAALEAAIACDDRPLQASAAALLALVESESVSPDTSTPALVRAADLLDRLSDEDLATCLEATFHVGLAEVLAERFPDALRHVERGVDVARAAGNDQHLLALLFQRAASLGYVGRLREATEEADTAVEMARLVGSPAPISWATGIQCWVAICRGDTETALRAGLESVETSRSHWTAAAAGTMVALVRLESGEAERGRNEMLAAGGGPELSLLAAQHRCAAFEAMTRAELSLGDPEAADGWARRAETAAFPGRPVSAGHALRARAEVLLAAGDPERAAALALDAATGEDAAGACVAAARSRTLAGRALASAGQRDRAVAELQQAEARLAASGAERYADEAARELRRLGRRVTRTGRGAGSGELGLTRRELEVARLVTLGRGNREIAAELFVSEKTVETHLSNVFTKLGVTSRAAVAGVLARRLPA
jgi:DNA-binding CsgD family transcriptional regulator